VVELMATPAKGWKFVEWQGAVTGAENPQQITVESPKEVTAVFEKKSYELTVNTDGEGAVEENVVKGKSYNYKTTVELTANPSSGWKFVEWQGAVTGTDNPAQVTIDDAKEVTAVFEKKSFSLTTNIEGEGSITRDPDQTEYNYNSSVTLTAEPAQGWAFVEWKGDNTSTDAAINVKMDQAKEVTAVFEKKSYELTVDTKGEGTVEEKVVKAKSYEHGTRVELTANPSNGWKFVEWQGAITGAENPQQITVDQAKEVTAVFEKKSYELTVNTDGEGAVEENVVKGKSYDYKTTVELTANPSNGWKFVEWKGAITETDNPTQITVDEAKEVTAVFEKKSFAVNVSTEGKGTVSKTPNQDSYTYQSSLDLEANPATGYKFVKWQGDIETTDNPVTITVDADPNFTAVFEKKSYAITVNTMGEGSVSKNPDQEEYKYKSSVTLTANPAQGWKFVEWKGDTSSTEASIELTIDQAKVVKAVFEEIAYTVDVSLDGSGTVNQELVSGKTVGNGYGFGSEVKVTVEAADGWNFVFWEEGFEGTDNPITVTIKDSVEATASLDESPFEGGNGSETHPYEVSNLDQLQAINDFTDSHFIQINDIDASATKNWNGGKGFRPIGDDVVKFRGTYNGKNYIISNVSINRGTSQYVGLFGFAEDANIRNMLLEKVSVEGSSKVGGLIGRTRQCEVSGAGITGNVNGTFIVGGLIGWNRSGTVKDSYSNANVSGIRDDIGGLIGRNEVGSIINSYSKGSVEGGGESIGGLIGVIAVHGSVRNSYSHSSVNGDKQVGGLVGTNNFLYNDPSTITSSYSTGRVSGSQDIGGLVGISAGEVSTSYWNTKSTNQNEGIGRGSADGTTGLTTSQMTGSTAKDNMPAFDFSDIWVTTDNYPILQWQK
jgi:ligand-binding SRPBCC domain-containing protein